MSLWHRDPQTEQQLKDLGIQWKYQSNIPIKDLKVAQSQKNNPRYGEPLDETNYKLMAMSMKFGHSFPAITIGPLPNNPSGKFILAGNHRVRAAQESGRDFIDAYVVESLNEYQYDQFIHKNNITHGLNITEEQKIQTCLEIHHKHGKSIKDLNDEYFAGDKKYYNKIVAADEAAVVAETLREQRIDDTKICPSSKTALHRIKNDVNILKDAARLIIDYDLSTSDVEDLTKKIREKRSESDRAAFLVETKKVLQQKTKTGVMPPETDLKRKMNSFCAFLATGYKKGRAFPSVDEFSSAEGAKELRDTAQKIIEALKVIRTKSKG